MRKPGKDWKLLFCGVCENLVGYYNPKQISSGAISSVRCSEHITLTAKPIPREFVEKWAERLREWATDENSTLKLAENIIQIMLHELGHTIEGEK